MAPVEGTTSRYVYLSSGIYRDENHPNSQLIKGGKLLRNYPAVCPTRVLRVYHTAVGSSPRVLSDAVRFYPDIRHTRTSMFVYLRFIKPLFWACQTKRFVIFRILVGNSIEAIASCTILNRAVYGLYHFKSSLPLRLRRFIYTLNVYQLSLNIVGMRLVPFWSIGIASGVHGVPTYSFYIYACTHKENRGSQVKLSLLALFLQLLRRVSMALVYHGYSLC